MSTPTPTNPTPPALSLTIAVPAYNEAATVEGVVGRLLALELPIPVEILVVDDGSTDGTGGLVTALDDVRVRLITHETNRGKGAAVRTALAEATGSHFLIFDADDEYDPTDIPSLIDPLTRRRAEVVYGVRLAGINSLRPSLIHAVGNRVMTWTANILFGTAITDLHTCLKLLPVGLLRSMTLREQGFGLDTEISAEMLRSGFRPFEVPVSYVGRTAAEGKKIKVSDALVCFWVLAKVRTRPKTGPDNRNRSLAAYSTGS